MNRAAPLVWLVGCQNADKTDSAPGLVCVEAVATQVEIDAACTVFAQAAAEKIFNYACDAYWAPRPDSERTLAGCIFIETLTQQCIDAVEATDDPITTAENVAYACRSGGDIIAGRDYYRCTDYYECSTYIDLDTYQPRLTALDLCPCAATTDYVTTYACSGDGQECLR